MKDDVANLVVDAGEKKKVSAGAPTYPVGTIAKLLMITERRVQQLSAEGVIPKSERGRYELAPAVQGYIRYLQERSVQVNAGPVDYHQEKALLTKTQRETAELELSLLRGDIAPIREFERVQAATNAAIRANVMNVPGRAVLQLLSCTDETEFKTKLRAELVMALETVAQADIDLPDDDDAEGQVEVDG